MIKFKKRSINMEKIIIASDHAGFELKNKIINFLKEEGYDITDNGTYSSESVDYPQIKIPFLKVLFATFFAVSLAICG